jgi:PKD repeat protein
MKRFFLSLALVSFVSIFLAGQTVTELVVPRYMGSKNANSTNNARTAFAVCIKIDGLVASTSYDVRAGLGLVTDASTSYGAGNNWYNNAFQAVNMLNYFTTNASGSSGPIWIIFQPTGNGTRFDAGQQHNLRIGWTINGNTMPGSPSFVGTKLITALDIPTTARTPATTDDGCFVKGSALPGASGKYVLLFDNVAGTGDPLFSYMIRQMVSTQSGNTELPTPINDVYMQAGTSAVGDYPAVIPIGANNPSGVRRIEARNADNTQYAFNTDSDGIWPSGGNTTNPARRDVVYITNTDAPLTPPVFLPTVTTSPVTNINFNSATCGGNVTSDGGATITARGVCWATTHNPTTAQSHTTDPGTTGTYTSLITGLLPMTQYYTRAYATNSVGTTYGAEVGFVTACLPYAPAPNFWASNTTIMMGQSVNFFDSTLYCPNSWNWSFVGGVPATSTAQNPTNIQFPYPGVYNVCLTTTNGYGTTTNCKMGYITVNGPTNAKVVITEIMYNPPEAGTDSLEFIELYNNDVNPIQLKDYYFSEGVVFTFPTYSLDPQDYVLVAKSIPAMAHTFGVPALQWTSGTLSNTGELIRLKDRYGFTVDSVNYLPGLPWDSLANGRGPSLELCDPNSNNALAANWRHGLEFRAKNASGDSIFCSPLLGCSYPPVCEFTSDVTAIPVNGHVNFNDLSTGAITGWKWEFPGGTPATYTAQVPPPVQYHTAGTYNVSLTVTNIAGQSKKLKDAYIEVGTTGVAPAGGNDGISVSPNPTTGKFTLRFSRTSTYEIRVISTVGLDITTLTTSKSAAEIDLTGQPKGVYFVRITDLSTGNPVIRRILLQ